MTELIIGKTYRIMDYKDIKNEAVKLINNMQKLEGLWIYIQL